MMPELTQVTPEVTWAQRSSSTDASRNVLYVTIVAIDVAKSDADLKITPTNVTFTGDSKKGVKYHVSLDLFGELDVENCKSNHSDRDVELVLRKKELKDEFWPRLTKEKVKLHFLKTDFDKWVDEDEQDEAAEDDYANNFGGGGMEGMDPQGGLGNIDFSKLGAGMEGMGGMGGMGGMADMMSSMGGMDPAAAAAAAAGGDEGDDDEADMPDLEEAEGSASKESKIQEVA